MDNTVASKRPVFRQKDHKLNLTCEWNECNVTYGNVASFADHVKSHIDDVVQNNENQGFLCQWCDCMHHIDNGPLEFTRHVFFHAFHLKLKSIGMSYIVKTGCKACMLDASGRNIVPELPDRFHCGWSDCEFVLDNPEGYYYHVSQHIQEYPEGKNVPGGCKCLWAGCEVNVKSRYRMQEHLRSHTQEKVIACPSCGNLFSAITKFKDHLLKQDESLRTFQCSHCSKCFSREKLLRDHMRMHVSNYKCPFCEMTVTSPSHLRMHIKYRHTSDREFWCEVCNKGFKTERDIERHEKAKHMSNTYMHCETDGCEFKCKHQFQLNHHMRNVHDGRAAKYACHVCTNEYQRGRSLTVHLMKQHGFRWMPGHRKFKYTLGEDGQYRLQTVRYESFELSQQLHEERYRKGLQISESTTRKSTQLRGSQSDVTMNKSDRSEHLPLDFSSTMTRAGLDDDARAATSARQTRSEPVLCKLEAGRSGRSLEDSNLELLGDVALNTSEEYSPRKQYKLRSRKSLEDTITAIKNTTRKNGDDPLLVSSSSSSIASEFALELRAADTSSKPHRRKVSPSKRSPRKRVRQKLDYQQQQQQQPEIGYGCDALPAPMFTVSEKFNDTENHMLDCVSSVPVTTDNRCKIVTEDGQMFYVNTHIPSSIAGLTELLDTAGGFDCDALPPGARIIATGSELLPGSNDVS